MDEREIDARLAGVLRGGPTDLRLDNRDTFVRRAEVHGVTALVYDRTSADQHAAIREAVRGRVLAQHFWEVEHRRLLGQVLAALAARGIRPILIKGTSVAYGLYSEPALRTRGDSDMLVPPGDRIATETELRELGFDRATAIEGDLLNHQASYVLRDIAGREHVIDLHWRINNSIMLHRLFSYEELLSRAVPLPRLAVHALGTGKVDTMLIACMHRQVHSQSPYYVGGVAHFDADRLIWLYDIHLLAGTFAPRDWDELARCAGEKGLLTVVVDGLRKTRDAFGTAVPTTLTDGSPSEVVVEPASAYLGAGAARREWMELCAQDGFFPRIRYLRQIVFPSAAFTRSRFPAARVTWLPWLYVRRAIRGVWKRLGRATAAR